MVGSWSYPVPEFTVKHFGTPKTFTMKRSDFADFDVIVREDHKCYGEFVKDSMTPLVYVVVDSTLSEQHFRDRLPHAQSADLALIEQDSLARFVGCTTRRLPYCVNENLYKDYGSDKPIDVGFYCNPTPQREKLACKLKRFCEMRGYVFDYGKREGIEYAKALNGAKINISLARTSTNRPHRTFDVMACRSCLLTSALPKISGEERKEWVHYAEFDGGEGGAMDAIDDLLQKHKWRDIADAGYALVREKHTWAVRATELRQIFYEVFKI
jgi:hypothetical protein